MFIVLALVAGCCPALAYETQTHALITREAYARSSLASDAGNSIRHRTGLNRLHPYSVFNAYWSGDTAAYYLDGGDNGPTASVDYPDRFEKCQMRAFLGLASDETRIQYYRLFANTVESSGYPEILPIQNWLIRGAIREDDMGDGIGWLSLSKAICGSKWGDTIENQPGRIMRPFRHFFDPIYRRGLSVAGIGYPRSVDWALGYQDSFANPRSQLTGAA